MDPYASPPFLGPLHAVLHIDWKDLSQLPASAQSYSVRFPALPLRARLAGFSFGERFAPFADATPTAWTVTVSLGGTALLTSGAGTANPPAAVPVGLLPAPFYFGQPVGDKHLELAVSVAGSALPATVTGSQSLASPFNLSSLTGLTLTLATDDRAPLTATFATAPTSAADVLNTIQDALAVDPVVSLDDGNHLVLQSGSVGSAATVTVIGGTALTALGLPAGTAEGTGPSPGGGPALVTGTADLDLVTASHGLDGLTFSFSTDDRGPFTVTFGAPRLATDVKTAVRNATLTDPVVSLSATSQIVIRSGNAGSSAYVDVDASSTAAPVLGLTTGYVYGTDGGALPAKVTGTATLSPTLYTTLIGQTLTLSTNGRTAFNVIFPSTLTTPEDVVTAIANVDPIVSTTGGIHNFLVLTSGSGSATPTVTLVDGTALTALGLTPGTTPSAATGTINLVTASHLYGPGGGLAGLGFTFQTDDRGPFTVTFGTGSAAPGNADDVIAAIAAATITDPLVSVDGNDHLVVQTRSTGSAATLTLGGNALGTLGLGAPTYTYPINGTSAPGVNGATAGHVDAHLFYFVDRG